MPDRISSPHPAPRKRFGQNFLVDPEVVDRIIAHVQPRAGDRLVEIGPGRGALTGPLLSRLDQLNVVEIDRDLAARLRAAHPPQRLTVIEADALKVDFAALGPDLRVVGNLPYNISTPILFHLAGCAGALRDLVLMLQQEVVDRMAAPAGSRDRGRLSVMVQYHFQVTPLFAVPPTAFHPVPKVHSAVVHLAPVADQAPRAGDEALLGALVTAAFGQRRKTLRNSLSRLADEAALAACGIDAGARAETVPLDRFVALANHLLATDTAPAHRKA